MSQAHSIQGVSVNREENDFYPTPPEGTLRLLQIEEFRGSILEPACGDGAISKVLKLHYPNSLIHSTDLIDRGYGEGQIDFLTHDYGDWKVDNIITNPPYGKATEFVEKSLMLARNKVAMLLKIQFLEGVKRRDLFLKHPPKTVHVFSQRLKINKNGQEGKNSTMMTFAWFIWEQGNTNKPVVNWI